MIHRELTISRLSMKTFTFDEKQLCNPSAIRVRQTSANGKVSFTADKNYLHPSFGFLHQRALNSTQIHPSIRNQEIWWEWQAISPARLEESDLCISMYRSCFEATNREFLASHSRLSLDTSLAWTSWCLSTVPRKSTFILGCIPLIQVLLSSHKCLSFSLVFFQRH